VVHPEIIGFRGCPENLAREIQYPGTTAADMEQTSAGNDLHITDSRLGLDEEDLFTLEIEADD
jgi:hypothetical protein